MIFNQVGHLGTWGHRGAPNSGLMIQRRAVEASHESQAENGAKVKASEARRTASGRGVRHSLAPAESEPSATLRRPASSRPSMPDSSFHAWKALAPTRGRQSSGRRWRQAPPTVSKSSEHRRATTVGDSTHASPTEVDGREVTRIP